MLSAGGGQHSTFTFVPMKNCFFYLLVVLLFCECKTSHSPNDLQKLVMDAPNDFWNFRKEIADEGITDRDTVFETKPIFGGRYPTSISSRLYRKDSNDTYLTRLHDVTIYVQDEWVSFAAAQSIVSRYVDSVHMWLGKEWKKNEHVRDWKDWGAKGTRFTKDGVDVIVWYTWNYRKKDSLQYAVQLDVVKQYPEKE